LLFQAPNLRLAHGQAAGYAKVPSEIEQVVLYIFQPSAQHIVEILGKQYADTAVQLVHGTDSLDARAFLSAPAAIPQPRGTVVSGACVDPGQTISHVCFPGFREIVPEMDSAAILRILAVLEPCGWHEQGGYHLALLPVA
jgi:hypothetical protein